MNFPTTRHRGGIMGILDRVQDRSITRLQDESQAATEATQRAAKKANEIARIITECLQKFAADLGEELEVIEDGQLYRLSDVVLEVRPFNKDASPDPDSGETITTDYLVRILAKHLRRRTEERFRVGTLRFITFDTIANVIDQNSMEVDFSADVVLGRV